MPLRSWVVQAGVQRGWAEGSCCTELGTIVDLETGIISARSHCCPIAYCSCKHLCTTCKHGRVHPSLRSPGPPATVTVTLANTATSTRVVVRVAPPVGSTGTGEQAGRPGYTLSQASACTAHACCSRPHLLELSAASKICHWRPAGLTYIITGYPDNLQLPRLSASGAGTAVQGTNLVRGRVHCWRRISLCCRAAAGLCAVQRGTATQEMDAWSRSRDHKALQQPCFFARPCCCPLHLCCRGPSPSMAMCGILCTASPPKQSTAWERAPKSRHVSCSTSAQSTSMTPAPAAGCAGTLG